MIHSIYTLEPVELGISLWILKKLAVALFESLRYVTYQFLAKEEQHFHSSLSNLNCFAVSFYLNDRHHSPKWDMAVSYAVLIVRGCLNSSSNYTSENRDISFSQITEESTWMTIDTFLGLAHTKSAVLRWRLYYTSKRYIIVMSTALSGRRSNI